MDIVSHITDVSRTVIHSHHSAVQFSIKFPDNYIRKPDIKEFTEKGAWFDDGSYEELDDVIYCTGETFQ